MEVDQSSPRARWIDRAWSEAGGGGAQCDAERVDEEMAEPRKDALQGNVSMNISYIDPFCSFEVLKGSDWNWC